MDHSILCTHCTLQRQICPLEASVHELDLEFVLEYEDTAQQGTVRVETNEAFPAGLISPFKGELVSLFVFDCNIIDTSQDYCHFYQQQYYPIT